MSIGDSGSLHHTCFIVRDIEATARTLAASLGVTWNVWTIEPRNCTVHGEEVPYSFRLAIAPVGDSNLELIAPVSGESVYVEHLRTRGEGFHHTCIAFTSLAAMHQARTDLERQDWKIIQSGQLGDDSEFYYFQIPDTDSVLELLYLDELPPPEAVIGSGVAEARESTTP